MLVVLMGLFVTRQVVSVIAKRISHSNTVTGISAFISTSLQTEGTSVQIYESCIRSFSIETVDVGLNQIAVLAFWQGC